LCAKPHLVLHRGISGISGGRGTKTAPQESIAPKNQIKNKSTKKEQILKRKEFKLVKKEKMRRNKEKDFKNLMQFCKMYQFATDMFEYGCEGDPDYLLLIQRDLEIIEAFLLHKIYTFFPKDPPTTELITNCGPHTGPYTGSHFALVTISIVHIDQLRLEFSGSKVSIAMLNSLFHKYLINSVYLNKALSTYEINKDKTHHFSLVYINTSFASLIHIKEYLMHNGINFRSIKAKTESVIRIKLRHLNDIDYLTIKNKSTKSIPNRAISIEEESIMLNTLASPTLKKLLKTKDKSKVNLFSKKLTLELNNAKNRHDSYNADLYNEKELMKKQKQRYKQDLEHALWEQRSLRKKKAIYLEDCRFIFDAYFDMVFVSDIESMYKQASKKQQFDFLERCRKEKRLEKRLETEKNRKNKERLADFKQNEFFKAREQRYLAELKSLGFATFEEYLLDCERWQKEQDTKKDTVANVQNKKPDEI
jgi:hypothetical protein